MIFCLRALGRWLHTFLPIGLLGALFLYALWPWLSFHQGRAQPRTLVFYGSSILEEVMKRAIFPAFQSLWLKKTGEHVEIISAFSGSGTITNQLLMGAPAELASVSLELDAQRLSDSHLTGNQSWRCFPYNGVINRTPIIFLVRHDNPKGIHDFADLTRPGIKVVHPDPLTSGASNWAIVAEYGSAQRLNPDQPQAGHDLLFGIWRNVVARASSARAARTLFENGFGDVLVTYEQDVLSDCQHGRLRAEIVYPHSSILSDQTLVVIDKNVRPEERNLVDTWSAFLWSEQAQQIFVDSGFRSVKECLNEEKQDFGKIADLFQIEDFGGWGKAKRDIIDGVWKNQVLKELGR